MIRTDAGGNTQTMSIGYDIFSDTRGISIGEMPLVAYEYGADNGNTITFTYDDRQRITKTTY